MKEDFILYFQIGWSHLFHLDALDHLIFIASLACLYNLSNWKKVLILITAFTIGHSISLVLSSFNMIRFNSRWIEFLIPLTIIITCIYNLIQQNKLTCSNIRLNYIMAICFGFIHGMGFASTIRFMLAKAQTITVPLLSFNMGIEAAQALVVLSMLFIAHLLINYAGMKQKWWILGISVASGLAAVFMCIQRWPFLIN